MNSILSDPGEVLRNRELISTPLYFRKSLYWYFDGLHSRGHTVVWMVGTGYDNGESGDSPVSKEPGV
jgi:hypothetical protein